MKIVVDKAIPFIEGRFPNNVVVDYLPAKDIDASRVKDADALIVRTRTLCDENLLKDSNVKLISTATIGLDHIDIAWCERNGIEVKNAPGCNAPGVAQYVLASLLKSGFDPNKHTLGIIGYGNVGKIVADWAKELGITIMISDAPLKEAGFTDINYEEKENLLKECDAVTLHVPLNKGGEFPTYHLISERELTLMKPGAILVNTSRGGVTDEKALKKELKNGRLRAITDVWENEPEIDEELAILSLISTPHIAGYSYQGKQRATRMALETVRDSLNIPVDLSGLECMPTEDRKISRQLIEESYDPLSDTSRLIKDPKSFERLRNEYNYRIEPLFS